MEDPATPPNTGGTPSNIPPGTPGGDVNTGIPPTPPMGTPPAGAPAPEEKPVSGQPGAPADQPGSTPPPAVPAA